MAKSKSKKAEPVADAQVDFDFLKELDARIWTKHNGYDRIRGSFTYRIEVRGGVTAEEWRRIERAAAHCIVEPINACMGFNFGLNLWQPMEPDSEAFSIAHRIKLKPTPLLAITGGHFDTRFEATWEKMSPLSHNMKNATKLKLYGFEPPREQGHYDY